MTVSALCKPMVSSIALDAYVCPWNARTRACNSHARDSRRQSIPKRINVNLEILCMHTYSQKRRRRTSTRARVLVTVQPADYHLAPSDTKRRKGNYKERAVRYTRCDRVKSIKKTIVDSDIDNEDENAVKGRKDERINASENAISTR